jgi:hypothetical protein
LARHFSIAVSMTIRRSFGAAGGTRYVSIGWSDWQQPKPARGQVTELRQSCSAFFIGDASIADRSIAGGRRCKVAELSFASSKNRANDNTCGSAPTCISVDFVPDSPPATLLRYISPSRNRAPSQRPEVSLLDRRRFLSAASGFAALALPRSPLGPTPNPCLRRFPMPLFTAAIRMPIGPSFASSFLFRHKIYLNNGIVGSSPAPVLRAIFDGYTQTEKMDQQDPEDYPIWDMPVEPVS